MSFNDTILTDKLRKLNSTQQSIQTLSHWVSYHKKYYKDIVRIWQREIEFATGSAQALAFLYLANDVMQNTRKKTMDFVTAFGDVMGDVFRTVLAKMPQLANCSKELNHLIEIWEERKVLSPQLCRNLHKSLGPLSVPAQPARAAPVMYSADEGFVGDSEDMITCERHWRQYRRACERTRDLPPCALKAWPTIEEMDCMSLEELRQNFDGIDDLVKRAQEEEVAVRNAMADKLAFFQFLDATFFSPLKTEVKEDQQRLSDLEAHIAKSKSVANYVSSRVGHHGKRPRDPKPPTPTRPAIDPRPQPTPIPIAIERGEADPEQPRASSLRDQAARQRVPPTAAGPEGEADGEEAVKRRKAEAGPAPVGGAPNLNCFLESIARKFEQDFQS
eukprot:EG_transcript_14842